MSAAGLNEVTIRNTGRQSSKDDIAVDKLSVKAYENPFKGQARTNVAALGAAKAQGHGSLNKVKASAFKRWPVSKPYRLCANHPFDGWL